METSEAHAFKLWCVYYWKDFAWDQKCWGSAASLVSTWPNIAIDDVLLCLQAASLIDLQASAGLCWRQCRVTAFFNVVYAWQLYMWMHAKRCSISQRYHMFSLCHSLALVQLSRPFTSAFDSSILAICHSPDAALQLALRSSGYAANVPLASKL